MKLHTNEFVISSHPILITTFGIVEKVVLITSFGRVFEYNVLSLKYELVDESLAS